MILRYYGTAMLTIEYEGTKILVDPYFNRNPKLYQPKAEEFDDVDAVIITHGHFDHIEDLPKILERKPSLNVYCTKQAKINLDAIGSKGGNYKIIDLDDSFEIGPFKLKSIRSAHVKNDFAYIFRRAIDINFYLQLPKLYKILKVFSKTPLGDECIEFLIEAGGKSILLAGSLGDDTTINHPKNVDVFVLPYNGRWAINDQMYTHVRRILPKKIFMTHFDAAFPPLCMDAQPERFKEFLKDKMSDIEVIIPDYIRSYLFETEKAKEETLYQLEIEEPKYYEKKMASNL